MNVALQSASPQYAAIIAKLAEVEHERDHYKRELGILRDMSGEARVASMLGLTPKEAALMMVLYARPGKCFSESAILTAIYSERDEPGIDIIGVYVCKIRKKLGKGVIDTIWGKGFTLTPAGVERVEKAMSMGSC